MFSSGVAQLTLPDSGRVDVVDVGWDLFDWTASYYESKMSM
jgi:hypothetical protein